MHRAAAIQCWRWRRVFALDPDVRTWTANGFFWVGNFAMAVGGTFAAGGCLVLQRLFDAGEALRLMQEERVSKLLAWPHQWARLVEDPLYLSVNLSSLHYVPLSSPLRTHPTVKTDWHEPLSAFGSTETLSINTIFPSGTPREMYEGNHGVPCPGNTIRIVDPLTGAVLPRGQSGEIAVKGPTLMLGYLRVPPENVFDDDGFFHSGDGGFVDDAGSAALAWTIERHHQDRRRQRLAARGRCGPRDLPRRQDRGDGWCAARHPGRAGGRVHRARARRRARRRLRSVPSPPRVSRATRSRAA